MDFHDTQMGHQFYMSTMPRIAKSLEKITEELEPKPDEIRVTLTLQAEDEETKQNQFRLVHEMLASIPGVNIKKLEMK